VRTDRAHGVCLVAPCLGFHRDDPHARLRGPLDRLAD
jgi:hypothetical protein